MDTHLAQRTTRATRPGWASESDWGRYRPVISELYEKYYLKTVMEKVEAQYQFRATLKMYKTRVQQWGLDKKNKESEMKAIARKRTQRLSEGKASIFQVRGRPVGFEEVVRYFGRKDISVEEVAAEEDAPKTPTDVACFTPPVSEVATPVPASMTTPDVFVLPEQTLILIQDYLKGSFDSGTWVRTNPRNYCYSVKDRGITSTSIMSVNETRTAPLVDMDMIEDCCILACDLFSRGIFTEAGETLIHATAAIKQIVSTEDPHTLIRLLSIFRRCLFKGRHEIDLALLRQLFGMGEVLLGERHPFSRICLCLASYDRVALQSALETCSRMITEIFASMLGRLHVTTLYASSDYAWIVGFSNRDQARTRLEHLLAECQSDLDSHDGRILEARRMLMDLLTTEGDMIEAERHAWDLVKCADQCEDMQVSRWYRVYGLRILAISHHATGHIELAITELNQALGLHGCVDTWARRWLWDLEMWYAEQGKNDAAVQMQHKRLASLEAEKAANKV